MSDCWRQVQAAWVATWNCYVDVPQTLAVGQLSKGHDRELIPAGEIVDLVIATTRLFLRAARQFATFFDMGMGVDKKNEVLRSALT